MYRNPHGLVGQTIDTYKIEEILGYGGMGVVFRAENTTLESKVALKIISPQLVENTSFIRRFEQEAKVLAKLRHPNIVQIYDLRHTDDLLYFVMELVEGETLESRLIREGHVPWKQSLGLVKQLLSAFQFAHDANIIHRDIKPGNIMINSQERVKVLDFGLAKLLREGSIGNATLAMAPNKGNETMTQIGAGTPKYTSPEQAKGEPKIDHRADIFSLGMTLYEVLSGALPFEKTDSIFTIQQKIVEEDFKPVHVLNRDVPKQFSEIVAKAIEKKASDRFSSAKEMLMHVEALERQVIKEELKTLKPDPSISKPQETEDDEDTIVLEDSIPYKRVEPVTPGVPEEEKSRSKAILYSIFGAILLVAGLWGVQSGVFGGGAPNVVTSTGGQTEEPIEEFFDGPVREWRILSNPSGASILINGQQKGITPATLGNLPLDEEHVVEIILAGYEVYSNTLLLTEDTPTLSTVLTPLLGDLEISIEPSSALMYIDGVRYEEGASKLFNLALPGIPHEVRLEMGSRVWEDNIDVVHSTNTLVQVDFRESLMVHVEAEDESGNPVSGQILVDGTPQSGKLSPEFVQVSVGLHTFEVLTSDNKRYIAEYNVSEGKELNVMAK